MRRITYWALSTLTALVLLFSYRTSTSGASVSSPTSIVADQASSSPGGSTTVTGDAVSTRWGPVQVAVTVEAGVITDVQVVEYPQGNHRDVEINGYALPELVQETLDAQSADIDMVSGATVTSDGYVRSLQSALDELAA